ncbi:MAG: collagen-like protein, partial [Lachnospiraceae bacterium]|nr:collagen-like protein [Lachnospiraceae bacterium]
MAPQPVELFVYYSDDVFTLKWDDEYAEVTDGYYAYQIVNGKYVRLNNERIAAGETSFTVAKDDLDDFAGNLYTFVATAAKDTIEGKELQSIWSNEAVYVPVSTGPEGPEGPAGQNGNDGKSAYEIAIENGYTGTLEEWLKSIAGTDGKDGKDGATGARGEKGETGANGDKGDTGDKGDKGEAGAKGDKGEAGAKGDKGETGAKGDKGETGAKGDKGETGAQGEKGETGAKGDKGDKGDKGEDGRDGVSVSEVKFENGKFVVVLTDGKTIESNNIISEIAEIEDDDTPLSYPEDGNKSSTVKEK